MIPLTEREAQGLLVALRNAVQEAAQFQQAVAGLSAQITQPADVATLVRGVSAGVRVPLLLVLLSPLAVLPWLLLLPLLFRPLSKLLLLPLSLLSLAVTPPVLTEVRERPRLAIIR